MASEVSEMNRQQVLMQAGTAMLAQANQSSQAILKLLAA
jgi:flagellin